MSALDPLRPRLARLVRLLASDRDGEVLGAARAIGRLLETAGADFHDLADLVECAPEPDDVDGDSSWTGLVDSLADHLPHLTPRDRRFVLSMQRLLAVGAEPTEAQAKWLNDIAGKIRRAAA